MMMHGVAHWAKIVGKPAKGYNAGEFEWSIDVSIDDKTKAKLTELGVGDKIKNKGDVRGDFIQFKRKSVRRDGTPSQPFEIVDNQGNPWPPNTLIGNGSEVNVKYLINETTRPGGQKGLKPSALAIQVWNLVPYEGGDREEFPSANEKEDWS